MPRPSPAGSWPIDSQDRLPVAGTLLVVCMGELGKNVLEAVGCSNLFERIVVASRFVEKAMARINKAAIGCGIEGCLPHSRRQASIQRPGSVRTLRALALDVIFCAPTLRPWWKVGRLDGTGLTTATDNTCSDRHFLERRSALR